MDLKSSWWIKKWKETINTIKWENNSNNINLKYLSYKKGYLNRWRVPEIKLKSQEKSSLILWKNWQTYGMQIWNCHQNATSSPFIL